jgi:hypothetical protein
VRADYLLLPRQEKSASSGQCCEALRTCDTATLVDGSRRHLCACEGLSLRPAERHDAPSPNVTLAGGDMHDDLRIEKVGRVQLLARHSSRLSMEHVWRSWVPVQMRLGSDWLSSASSRVERGTRPRPRNRPSRNLSDALVDGSIERKTHECSQHNPSTASPNPPYLSPSSNLTRQWFVTHRLRLRLHPLHLTPAGPPHYNPSCLLGRTHNRPRRLRILSSSGRRPKIRCRQPKWRWFLVGLLLVKHHHGRSMQHLECWTRQDGQH